ncbi:MAG: restriction endonuclease [Thermoguttaceae bacterium]|jgi:HJR/Mrr/RecB family endonuclease
MIITQSDIDEFVSTYNDFCNLEDVGVPPEIDNDEVLRWLADNPQVVIASGYQEFVAGNRSPVYRALQRDGQLDEISRPLLRDFHGHWIVPSMVGDIPDEEWGAFRLDTLLAISSMQRQLDLDVKEGRLTAHSPIVDERQARIDDLSRESVVTMPSFNRMVEIATKYVDNPLIDPTTWVSPRLWTPSSQALQKDHLRASTLAVIEELQRGHTHLTDLSWQNFEEIVAEILRQRGMEIHLVKENPQGGRDIIARAELVPGSEVLTIAVEVKHRDVVDRPIVQQAIQQNERFPALMLVTSGRFTAGVVKEVAKPEHRMRVVLKDGVAIRDMIRAYRLT